MQILSTHGERDITLTQASISFIKRMIRLSGEGPNAGLRLVVEPGGCSGLESSFTVTSTKEPDDEILSFDDAVLIIPAACRSLLDGVTIDFADTSTRTGFVFIVPQGSGCACGPDAPASLASKVS